jgi:hypothetical protein
MQGRTLGRQVTAALAGLPAPAGPVYDLVQRDDRSILSRSTFFGKAGLSEAAQCGSAATSLFEAVRPCAAVSEVRVPSNVFIVGFLLFYVTAGPSALRK